MIAIIKQELRKFGLVPVGFLGLFLILAIAARSLGPSARYLYALYALGISAFGLYMGAEAVAGDHTRHLVEWQTQWPVSRLKWWATKLMVTFVIILLVTTIANALFATVAGQAMGRIAPGMKPTALLVLSLMSLGPFTIAFFVSTVTRSSIVAFFAAVGLSYVLTMAYALPLMLRMMLLGPRMMTEGPPSTGGYLAATSLVPLIFLVGSYLGYVTLPMLEFGRRTRRASVTVGVPMALLFMVLVGVQLHDALFKKPTPMGISSAVLSPDGQRIAFLGQFPNSDLWVMNADGSNPRRLMPEVDMESPVWLLDSRRLVASARVRTPQPRRPFRGRPVPPQSAQQQSLWWVVDAADEKSKPTSLPLTAESNTGMSRTILSPQGKYLILGDRFVDTSTWQAAGTIDSANYSPLLTWLPDDSAIYVCGRVRRIPPVPSEYKRIAVPSGQVTPANLPLVPIKRNNHSYWPQFSFPSESTDWLAEDIGTWVRTKPSEQKTITRTVPYRTREGKIIEKTMTYRTNTQRRIPKTLFTKLDGSRSFELPGLTPFNGGGLSPHARYCLMSASAQPQMLGASLAPAKLAIVDMDRGQVVRRFTVPSMDRLDNIDGPWWSPDEQWLALAVTRWERSGSHSGSHGLLDKFVHVISLSGQDCAVKINDLGGFGSNKGLAGWTAANELVVLRGGNQLVAISTAGQQRTILKTHSWVDEVKERSEQQHRSPAQGSQPPGPHPQGGPRVSTTPRAQP